MSSNTSGESQKKKGSGVIIAFLILIIAALIVTVVFLLGKNRDSQNISDSYSSSEGAVAEKRNVVVNKENVEEIIEQLSEEEKTPAGNYEVVMNTTWEFENGSSPSENAYVENAETNTNDVYFDILLADTEETIYASPVLPVGSYIENITLDKELEAGTYDCVIVYNLIDKEQNVLSDVRVALVINVHN